MTTDHLRTRGPARLAWLALLPWLWLPLPAAADTLDAILAALSLDAPAEMAFREVRQDPMLQSEDRQSGRIAFEPPDTLIRETDGRRGEHVRIEGRELTLTRGDSVREIRLDDQPGLEAFAGLFRSLLQGDREALEAGFEVELDGDLEAWELELRPRDRALRRAIIEITIRGREGEIRRMDTWESGNRTSRMHFEAPASGDPSSERD
ncbi:LolA-related protein [Thioalkalivibrio sp. AKL17]|uniref:LolA-related protein n=1 Tax=Thioalkalivibrio sp. AKL17 TaxID=1158160 RepID=UPI00037C49C8|nr:LolA-related protein [Thioalkalivibrio sp. AKL17]